MSAELQVGIKSFGVYVPRRRMARAAIAEANAWAFPAMKAKGKGEKSFCNWDEDVITMAVEAARDALRGGFSTSALSNIDLASTTAPYADNQNAAIVAAALSSPAGVCCTDAGGSIRSGLSALIRALATRAEGDQLVVASEKRRAKPGSIQEMTYGSAAASVLLGTGEDVIARSLGAVSVTAPFIDHFRKQAEAHDYVWEERWVRDEGVSGLVVAAVHQLLEKIGRNVADINKVGLSGGPVGADKVLARRLGVSADAILTDLQGVVGDTGSAQSLMQLSAALESGKAGDLVLLVSFASGCDVLALEVNKVPENTGRLGLAGNIARSIPDNSYTKMLSHDGEISLDWGMRAERDNKTPLTALNRYAAQILGFVGGRCADCKSVQFPRLPYCVECGSGEPQQSVPLSGEQGQVATHTTDWLMFTPAPPLYVGLVQFDNGARVMMEMVDVGGTTLEVGTPLEMVFRIKECDSLRNFDRYFWKATPMNLAETK